MIRRAELPDVEQIADIGAVFFKEAGWFDVTEWNREKAVQAMTGMVENADCFIFLYMKDAEIIGMIGAFISDVWFSDDRIGQELFWYVKPEHRGGIGHRLFRHMEDALSGAGAQLCSMFTVDKIDAMDGYFRKAGYRPSEHTYIKRF